MTRVFKNPFLWLLIAQCLIGPLYVWLRYRVNLWMLFLFDSGVYRVKMFLLIAFSVLGLFVIEYLYRYSRK